MSLTSSQQLSIEQALEVVMDLIKKQPPEFLEIVSREVYKAKWSGEIQLINKLGEIK